MVITLKFSVKSFSEVPAAVGRLRIMPRKRNEVLVKWMDKSCEGQTNRVNIKHFRCREHHSWGDPHGPHELEALQRTCDGSS